MRRTERESWGADKRRPASRAGLGMSDSNLCFVMLELSPFLHPIKDMADECGLHDAIVGWIDKIAGVGYIAWRVASGIPASRYVPPPSQNRTWSVTPSGSQSESSALGRVEVMLDADAG